MMSNDTVSSALLSSRHVRELAQAVDRSHCARSNELANAGLSAEKVVNVLGLRKTLQVGEHGHHGGLEFEHAVLKKVDETTGKTIYPNLTKLFERYFSQNRLPVADVEVIDLGQAKHKFDYESKHLQTMSMVKTRYNSEDRLVVILNACLKFQQKNHIDWIRPDLLIKLPNLSGFLVAEIKGFVHAQEDDKSSDVARAIQQCVIGANVLIQNIMDHGITDLSASLSTRIHVAILCRGSGYFATFKLLDVSQQIKRVGEKLQALYSRLAPLCLDPHLDVRSALSNLLDTWRASYEASCHGQCSLSDYCATKAREKGYLHAVLDGLPLDRDLTWQDVIFQGDVNSPNNICGLNTVDSAKAHQSYQSNSPNQPILIEPHETLFQVSGSGLSFDEYLKWIDSQSRRVQKGVNHD